MLMQIKFHGYKSKPSSNNDSNIESLTMLPFELMNDFYFLGYV